ISVVQHIGGHPVLFQYGRPVPSFSHLEYGSPSRTTTLLTEWSFAADPLEIGLDRGWHLPHFDDDGWRRVRVPHVWDHEDGGALATYDGRVWYRAAFSLPPT